MVKVLKTMVIGTSMEVLVTEMLINLGPCIVLFVNSGTTVRVLMEIGARKCTYVGHVPKLGKWASLTKHLPMEAPAQEVGKVSSVPSSRCTPYTSSFSRGKSWTTEDFIKAHKEVKASGMYNFQGCRIPVPTLIRHDRIREALGKDISLKEERMLCFGMPIGCKDNFGVQKRQKNHHSAVSHKEAIDKFFNKGIQMQEILGPFKFSPIESLCFSPMMTVPL